MAIIEIDLADNGYVMHANIPRHADGDEVVEKATRVSVYLTFNDLSAALEDALCDVRELERV